MLPVTSVMENIINNLIWMFEKILSRMLLYSLRSSFLFGCHFYKDIENFRVLIRAEVYAIQNKRVQWDEWNNCRWFAEKFGERFSFFPYGIYAQLLICAGGCCICGCCFHDSAGFPDDRHRILRIQHNSQLLT